MPFDSFKYHRRSIRLPDYDYSSPGAYFVTIATHNRQIIFGKIFNGVIQLNTCGEIVSEYWAAIPGHFPNVELDEFIVMPDHIHGIIVIHENDRSVRTVGARLPRPWLSRPESPENGSSGAGLPRPYESKQPFSDSTKHAPTLGQIVAFYKYQSTKRINQIHGTPGASVWQRNYYEHIIRDDDDLSRIREYIRNNSAQWETDNKNG